MIAVKCLFAIRDELKGEFSKIENVKKSMVDLVKLYKTVPGLKQKYFMMDPKTGAQGSFSIWESQEAYDKFLKSEVWKNTVLDICKGEPSREIYVVSASLTDGVVI